MIVSGNLGLSSIDGGTSDLGIKNRTFSVLTGYGLYFQKTQRGLPLMQEARQPDLTNATQSGD